MKALLTLAAIAVLLISAWVLGLSVNRLADPLLLAESRVFEVPRGQTAQGVLHQFAEQGWLTADVPPAPVLQLGLRLFPEWSHLRAGHYRVYPGDSLLSVARRMRAGDVATIDITLIEGLRTKDLLQLLRNTDGIVDDLDGRSGDQLMAEINPEWPYAEGVFLPETYRFPWGTRMSRVLRQMHQALEATLEQAWALCTPERCALKTREELLVLASIIEKETGVASERTEISGVFHRRLRKKMRLQTDPTVIYGVGDAFDGNLTRAHLRTDTPWNTYTRGGLPPTPICLPGRDSLFAAAQPKAGTSLYFVATGQGAHVFSDTLAEHQRAVRKYQLKRGK